MPAHEVKSNPFQALAQQVEKALPVLERIRPETRTAAKIQELGLPRPRDLVLTVGDFAMRGATPAAISRVIELMVEKGFTLFHVADLETMQNVAQNVTKNNISARQGDPVSLEQDRIRLLNACTTALDKFDQLLPLQPHARTQENFPHSRRERYREELRPHASVPGSNEEIEASAAQIAVKVIQGLPEIYAKLEPSGIPHCLISYAVQGSEVVFKVGQDVELLPLGAALQRMRVFDTAMEWIGMQIAREGSRFHGSLDADRQQMKYELNLYALETAPST